MGLDITYYRNLTPHIAEDEDDEEDTDYGIHLFGACCPDNMDNLVDGVYDGDQVGHFQAGSYSSYGEWRNLLCEMAHGVTAKYLWEHAREFAGKAFYELINFSDCEGTIGPATSAKLYRDFVKFEKKAKQVELYEGYFYENYKELERALVIASENGAVKFS